MTSLGLPSDAPVIRLTDAGVSRGGRVIWEGLDLDIAPGELLAVLGPNGAGKTTLLKVLLGLLPLSAGTVEVAGSPPRRGSPLVGYVPQQTVFDPDLPIRGRDLVALGLRGHRAGLPILRRRDRALINASIDAVGASGFADAPIGTCSGGEQQRLRIAQALLGEPVALLCDEPLLSLDPAQQSVVTGLIDGLRRRRNTAVVFVTHDINPVLSYVDRVLYLVGGRVAIGAPEEVLTSGRLSDLYGTSVDVLSSSGRLVVLGADDATTEPGGQPHHHPGDVAPGRAGGDDEQAPWGALRRWGHPR